MIWLSIGAQGRVYFRKSNCLFFEEILPELQNIEVSVPVMHK